MTQEEKAKAHDEAIEKAKIWQEHLYDVNDKDYADELNYIFPELAESDDERIRKALYLFVEAYGAHSQYATQEDMLAWLEKQANHANFRNKIQVGDKVTRNKDGVLVNLSQLNRVAKKDEKQGNNADKIIERAKTEKQRVILTETNGDANIDWDTRSLQDVKLLLEYGLDYIKKLEKQGEQKPADNLIQMGKRYKCVSSPRYTMFIIGKIYKPEDKFLCSLMNFCSDCFEPLEEEQKPADKVEPEFKVGDVIKPKDGGHEPWQIMQVDMLDKKYRFKDGYVIHFSQENDYELVEQTPAWSEEDKKYENIIVSIINNPSSEGIYNFHEVKCKDVIDWFKSLKDRVQPKQEWSEEDKRKLNRIYSILGQAADTHAFSTTCRLIGDKECVELQDFLKVLKERVGDFDDGYKVGFSAAKCNQWKPSEEQINALAKNVEYVKVGCTQPILKELLEDLKKLKS